MTWSHRRHAGALEPTRTHAGRPRRQAERTDGQAACDTRSQPCKHARDVAGGRGAPAGAVVVWSPPGGGPPIMRSSKKPRRQGHPRGPGLTRQRRGLAYLREMIGSARWRLPRVPAADGAPPTPGEPGVWVDVAVAARSDSDGLASRRFSAAAPTLALAPPARPGTARLAPREVR